MNVHTSLMIRAAVVFLGTAASFAANAGGPAAGTGDAQSIAQELLAGKSAHVVSFAAHADAAHFDAQQRAAQVLSGAIGDRALATARTRSLTAAAGTPLTARNADLEQAARHLLQGRSVD
jgi:hypothetical protein